MGLMSLMSGVIMRLEHHLVGGYVRYISPHNYYYYVVHVVHRFETDERIKWYKARVVSQVRAKKYFFMHPLSCFHHHLYLHNMPRLLFFIALL